jgi:FkbM family methyltransferase
LQAQAKVRAAAYVAVLPAEERAPGLRRTDQRRQLEQYISDRGWELEGVWEDVGIGARPARQPELERLLADLAGIDKLVVVELRRFGGWARRTAAILEQLEATGVDLVALDYGVDTGDASGAMFARLVSELAEGQWWDWRPENLQKPGFAPATVIDVGAGEGTLPLLRAFPEAYHVLIEPLAEYEPALEQAIATRRGEYLLTAVGAREGMATIGADHANPDRSSMLERVPARGSDGQIERREVPITTLDRLLKDRGWSPPFGLKIDTEGFEDEVVRGATSLLDQTQFVIAEISVRKRFEESYTFAELIALMAARGFSLGDVLVARRPPGTKALQYIDGVFWREE